MLIDSHAHLYDKQFDEDRDKIIKGFKDDRLELVINVGADLDSSKNAVLLSEEYDTIYAAVGVHPHDVKTMDEDSIETLKQLSKQGKVVAIGEIGLDYYYDNSPRDLQKKWFREQIKLAKELDLPIIVHSRDASQDVYEIIKEEQDGNLTGVIHCFSESIERAVEYIKLGFYISLGGPVTFKNAKTPKEVARKVPLDRLLIETDSPYLTPHPHRGKRNEPGNVRYVAEEIAYLKEISYEKLRNATNENTKRLFRIEIQEEPLKI